MNPRRAETSSGLVCDAPVWDLGEVSPEGDSASFNHTFRLENRSTQPIVIREVAACCGCLVEDGHARTIAAGSEICLKVTTVVAGPPGKFRRTILVKLQSDSDERLPLSVIGSRALSGLLYTAPRTLNFGQIVRGGTQTRCLVAARYNGTPVQIRAVVPESAALTIDGEPKETTKFDAKGNQFRCVELPLRLDTRSLPAGEFRSKVSLRTNAPEDKAADLAIPLEAVICEKESPWVKSVFLKRLRPGESVEVSIARTGWRDVYPKVVAISYEGDDSIQLRMMPFDSHGGPKTVPRVTLTRRAKPKTAGVVRGALKLKTRDAVGESTALIGVVAFLSE